MAFPAVEKFLTFGTKSSAINKNSRSNGNSQTKGNTKDLSINNSKDLETNEPGTRIKNNQSNPETSNRIMVNNNNQTLDKTQSRNRDKEPKIQNKDGLNTSIRSIESKHNEYSIYDRITGLNNPILNDAAMYEGKIREFAELLEKHVPMKTVYVLTFSQLIIYETKAVNTDQEYFKIIRTIINSPALLRMNSIKGLKFLQNKSNQEIKRILIGYIIYLYMGYNGLLILKGIHQRDKNTLTKIHWTKGAFKFNVDASHLVKQTFAEFIGENRHNTYELIKFHSYQSRMGESSYNNLKKQRRDHINNKIDIFMTKPAEFLNMEEDQYNNHRRFYNPGVLITANKKRTAPGQANNITPTTTTQLKWKKKEDKSTSSNKKTSSIIKSTIQLQWV